MTSQPKIIPEDDIEACDGDQLLGVFMSKLYAWADSTNAGLTKINGTRWIGCSTNRWITERKPWGKNNKVSKHQFERMLARGRKMGVLKTCQSPSRLRSGRRSCTSVPPTAIANAGPVRPNAGRTRGRCRAFAGPMQDRCRTLIKITEPYPERNPEPLLAFPLTRITQ